MIRLRPHHLLCIRGFRGKGYSEAFIRNMSEIVANLNEAAGQTDATEYREDYGLTSNPACRGDSSLNVMIVFGADDICRCCPHLTDEGVCDQDEKVSAYDRRAAEVLGLCEGIHECAGTKKCADTKECDARENGMYTRHEFAALQSKIDNAFDKDKLETVCGGCHWADLCKEAAGKSRYESV